MSAALFSAGQSLFLVIQAAVAVALVVGVCDLLLELPAHAAVLLRAGQTAGKTVQRCTPPGETSATVR